MIEIQEIKKLVQNSMSEKRFIHTMNVAAEAVRLAERWGANTDEANLAGLVHDCAKEIPHADALRMLSDFGFVPDSELMQCPPLLHGPLAAYKLWHEFGIQNKSVFDAVWYHTTGRADMALLEKIIYLADFIEPLRHFDGIDHVRRLAFEDIDKAVLCESEMVIFFTLEKGNFLHSDTVAARNSLLLTVTPDKRSDSRTIGNFQPKY